MNLQDAAKLAVDSIVRDGCSDITAWGKKKAVAVQTLKNHFCKNVFTFDSSLATLIERGLVTRAGATGPVYLDVSRKRDIEKYI